MREVEEDFAEDGEVAVVEREVEIAVFAAGGVRVDEHVMEALWLVVLERLWESVRRLGARSKGRPLLQSRVWRNWKDAEHLEAVKVALPLFCAGQRNKALPDSWGRFAH